MTKESVLLTQPVISCLTFEVGAPCGFKISLLAEPSGRARPEMIFCITAVHIDDLCEVHSFGYTMQ